MAIGKASDFLIKDDFFIGSFTETIAQNVQVFNAGSNGAIILRDMERLGDYFYSTFYTEIASFDVRRDTSSTAAVDPAAMGQEQIISVKLNRRQGPIEHTIDAFRKQGKSPEEMSVVLGEQSALAFMQAKLERGIIAATAALANVNDLVHDATDGTLAVSDIVYGMSKFQDNLNAAAAILIHDKVFYDLFIDQLTNFKIDNVAGVQIAQGPAPGVLGLPFVVTRSSNLTYTSGSDTYYRTLLLQPGAIEIEDSEVSTLHTWIGDKVANLTVGWQFEYAFNLGLKGFKWDTAEGGANPDDTALGLGTNWDQAATDVRNLAGAVVNSQ